MIKFIRKAQKSIIYGDVPLQSMNWPAVLAMATTSATTLLLPTRACSIIMALSKKKWSGFLLMGKN
jgi:hypothetical protein